MQTTHRTMLSALLMLSAISLLLTPMVNSQSLTTITSWTTVTGQVSSTRYSTFVVGTTTQAYSVTTTYLGSFSMPPLSPSFCYYNDFNFTFKAGTKLVGDVVPSGVMNFYVMSTQQFAQFAHAHCGDPVSALVHVENIVAPYSLDWVVPTDGTYYFVCYNYAPAGQGAGQVTGSFSLQYPINRSVTLTLNSTASNLIVGTTTQTMSSVYSTTVSALSLGGDMLYVALAAIAVLLIVLVVALLRRKPSKEEALPPRAPEQRMVTEPEATIFCINCGAKLRANMKFCNKCGSAQI